MAKRKVRLVRLAVADKTSYGMPSDIVYHTYITKLINTGAPAQSTDCPPCSWLGPAHHAAHQQCCIRLLALHL
jgi:hypothetical protein